MIEWAMGIGLAFWLGILTSISPCPLATNIAAISFLGRRLDRASSMMWGGLLYTVGRAVAYIALSVALIAGILAAPSVSYFLQRHMNQILGPLLVLAGMFLLGLLSFQIPGTGGLGQRIQARLEQGGLGVMGASFLLGVLFALSFCPVSAALFFGAFLPVAIKFDSWFFLPLSYGVGTALPVVAFAGLLAFYAQRVGQAFNRLTQFERIARRATGVLFILAGVYMMIVYIF